MSFLPFLTSTYPDEPVRLTARNLVRSEGAADVHGCRLVLLARGRPVHLLLCLPHPRPWLLSHDGRRLHLLRRRPLHHLPDGRPLQADQVIRGSGQRFPLISSPLQARRREEGNPGRFVRSADRAGLVRGQHCRVGGLGRR